MKVILDCDCGANDVYALLILLNAKHVELLAVTTTGGNGTHEQAYASIKKLLALTNHSHIPVYKGQNYNLTAIDNHPLAPCNGREYVGDVINCIDFKEPPHNEVDVPAHEALIAISIEHRNEVTLISTGPSSNIALACLNNRFFPKKIKQFFLFAGDSNGNSNGNEIENNQSYMREFNASHDPAALNVILSCFESGYKKPVTILTLDFFRKNNLIDHNKILEQCYQLANNNTQLNSKLYKFVTQNTVMLTDVYLVFAAVYSDQANSKGKWCDFVKVEIEGSDIGRTDFKIQPDGSFLLIEHVNLDNFSKVLTETLKSIPI